MTARRGLFGLFAGAAVLPLPPVAKPVEHHTIRSVTGRSDVSATVVATGDGSYTYQWSLNGEEIPGATSATLHGSVDS